MIRRKYKFFQFYSLAMLPLMGLAMFINMTDGHMGWAVMDALIGAFNTFTYIAYRNKVREIDAKEKDQSEG